MALAHVVDGVYNIGISEKGIPVRGQTFGLAAVAVLLTGQIVSPPVVRAGQESIVADLPIRHDRGAGVVPLYEGWYLAPDGSMELSFGYVNLNYEEEVDIPIGPGNHIGPGDVDQGQPTHFLPRRQTGVFTIHVPKGAPKVEYTWTLNYRGTALSVPASLSDLYLIYGVRSTGQRTFDNGGVPEDNTPPVVRFEPDGDEGIGPAGIVTTLRGTAGQPVAIETWVSDDGFPQRGGKPRGVSLTWSKFRGPGPVTFDPPVTQLPSEAVKATTRATFSTPGDYMVRVLASDGSNMGEQCCWTNGYVKVTVAPGTP